MDSPPWAVCVVGYRTRVPVRGAIVSCFGACWRCWPRIAENDSNPANSGHLDSTVTVRGAIVSTFGTMRALGRAMAEFDTLPDKFWSPPKYRTGMFARPVLSLRTEAGPPVVMLGFGAFAVRAVPPGNWRSTCARPRRPPNCHPSAATIKVKPGPVRAVRTLCNFISVMCVCARVSLMLWTEWTARTVVDSRPTIPVRQVDGPGRRGRW
jgi:hypothetical protein